MNCAVLHHAAMPPNTPQVPLYHVVKANNPDGLAAELNHLALSGYHPMAGGMIVRNGEVWAICTLEDEDSAAELLARNRAVEDAVREANERHQRELDEIKRGGVPPNLSAGAGFDGGSPVATTGVPAPLSGTPRIPGQAPQDNVRPSQRQVDTVRGADGSVPMPTPHG